MMVSEAIETSWQYYVTYRTVYMSICWFYYISLNITICTGMDHRYSVLL